MSERQNNPTSHSLIEHIKRFPLVRAISHIARAIQKLTDAHFTIYNVVSGRIPDHQTPLSSVKQSPPSHR